MKQHMEIITCPECGQVQGAIVKHTEPWYTYIHTCAKCDYTIMESEWNQDNTWSITRIRKGNKMKVKIYAAWQFGLMVDIGKNFENRKYICLDIPFLTFQLLFKAKNDNEKNEKK